MKPLETRSLLITMAGGVRVLFIARGAQIKYLTYSHERNGELHPPLYSQLRNVMGFRAGNMLVENVALVSLLQRAIIIFTFCFLCGSYMFLVRNYKREHY